MGRGLRNALVVVTLGAVVAVGCSSGKDEKSSKAPTAKGTAARSTGFAKRAEAYLATAASAEVAADASRDKVWRAVARLASDPKSTPALTVDDLGTITGRIAAFSDTTDFDLVALFNLWFRSDHGERLDPATADHIKGLMIGFKYWYDEPQPANTVDERWYWSENHQILYHAIEFLAGEEFPDATFTNDGKTGSQHADHARPLIEKWVEQRARYGFSEWYSNVYYREDLLATLALAEFADDDDVATRGAIASDLALYDLASHTFDGAFGATHGRTYKKDKMTALDEDTWDLSKLVLDESDLPYQSALDAVFLAAATKYRPPAVLGDIVADSGAAPPKGDAGGVVETARHSLKLDPLAAVSKNPPRPQGLAFDDPANLMLWWGMGALTPWQTVVESTSEMTKYKMWQEEQFSPFRSFEPIVKAASPDTLRNLARSLAPKLNLGLLSEANTYTWRSDGAMLSTAQDFRKGQASQQHHVWQATFSPEAQVFTTHPGSPTKAGVSWHENSDDWTGSASLPRSVQMRNVNISIYAPLFESKDALTGSYQEYTHAYLPQEKFDEVVRADNWTFARLGDEYLALYSWRTPSWVTYDSTFDTNGLKLPYVWWANGGPNNVWKTGYGAKDGDGTFADFQQAITANQPVVRPLGDPEVNSTGFDVDWTSPSQGPITFGWDKPLMVSGTDQPIADYPRIDSPWAQVPFDATDYVITGGKHSLHLDVTAPSRESSGGD